MAIRPPEPAPVAVKETISEAQIIEAFDILGITTGLDDKKKRLFIEISKLNNLNPLKREIHAVEMWDPKTDAMVLTPVTGYQVYLKRAEASGRLEYWFPVEDGTIKDGTYRAGIVIKRRDWKKEFTYWVRYSEVVRTKYDKTTKERRPMSRWATSPCEMTRKCAIGQAFRLAFPDELGDMPYTEEEAASMPMREVQDDTRPAIAEPVEKAEVQTETATPTGPSTFDILVEACRALKENMIKSKKFPDSDIRDMSGQCKAKIDAKDEPGLKAIYEEWKDFYDIEIKGGNQCARKSQPSTRKRYGK